jgi:hypothetical protein
MARADLMFVKEPLNLLMLILIETVFSPFYWKAWFGIFVKRNRFKLKVVVCSFTKDLLILD